MDRNPLQPQPLLLLDAKKKAQPALAKPIPIPLALTLKVFTLPKLTFLWFYFLLLLLLLAIIRLLSLFRVRVMVLSWTINLLCYLFVQVSWIMLNWSDQKCKIVFVILFSIIEKKKKERYLFPLPSQEVALRKRRAVLVFINCKVLSM